MKRAWMGLALAATIWGAATEKPRVKRTALTAMETSFDQRLIHLADDPYLLTGNTRGVYLEATALCSRRKSACPTASSPSPFRPSITNEDKAKIRAKEA